MFPCHLKELLGCPKMELAEMRIPPSAAGHIAPVPIPSFLLRKEKENLCRIKSLYKFVQERVRNPKHTLLF